MEPIGSTFCLALLVLVLLPHCLPAANSVCSSKNAHSLCYAFNVSDNRLPLCAGEAVVNGVTILYTCNNLKAKPAGSLEMMSNASETLNQQCELCMHLVDELRSSLLYNKPDFDLSSVQVIMRCQQESNGRSRPLLSLFYKKQRCLRIGPGLESWNSRNFSCIELKNLVDSHMNNVVRISSEVCAMWSNQNTVLDTKGT